MVGYGHGGCGTPICGNRYRRAVGVSHKEAAAVHRGRHIARNWLTGIIQLVDVIGSAKGQVCKSCRAARRRDRAICVCDGHRLQRIAGGICFGIDSETVGTVDFCQMIAARVQKRLGHRCFALVVIGLIRIVRALVPDGHPIGEGGIASVLLLLCHSEVVGCGIQYITFWSGCFGQTVDCVVLQTFLYSPSEGQCTVLTGCAGQSNKVLIWRKASLRIGALLQFKCCTGKAFACIILIQLHHCDAWSTVRADGATDLISEVLYVHATAVGRSVVLPMGVVGDVDGLSRHGADRGLISDRQGTAIRKNNFQRLSSHRGRPAIHLFVGSGINHLDGRSIQIQGIAQLVHQRDGV